MIELTGRQRRALRGAAHALSPSVHVGKQGITEAVRAQADAALADHELVKVRLLAERPQREDLARQLAVSVGAALVGSVGKVSILYRQHPDPRSRSVSLIEP